MPESLFAIEEDKSLASPEFLDRFTPAGNRTLVSALQIEQQPTKPFYPQTICWNDPKNLLKAISKFLNKNAFSRLDYSKFHLSLDVKNFIQEISLMNLINILLKRTNKQIST